MSASGSTYSAAGEVARKTVRRNRLQRAWLVLKKAPLSAWFGMFVLLGYVLVSARTLWGIRNFPSALCPLE